MTSLGSQERRDKTVCCASCCTILSTVTRHPTLSLDARETLGTAGGAAHLIVTLYTFPNKNWCIVHNFLIIHVLCTVFLVDR